MGRGECIDAIVFCGVNLCVKYEIKCVCNIDHVLM